MNELKHAIRNKTVIAYTGHTDSLPSQLPLIRQKLSEKLDSLIQNNNSNYVLITSLEEGTGSGIIGEALKKDIPLVLLTVYGEDAGKANELKEKHPQQSITVIKVTAEEKQDIQQAYVDALTLYTDVMIASWDGLYNSSASFTSFVADRFLHCTFRSLVKWEKTVYLHQLAAPHSDNPFPVARYNDEIDADVPQTVALQWTTTSVVKKSMIWDRGVGRKVKRLLTREFPNSTAILLQYVLPILLAFSVLYFGVTGFDKYGEKNKVPPTKLNAFFFAGNLITLNTSVFEFPADDISRINTARLLGGLLAAYAFVLAFTLALGYENFRRFRFFFTRLMNKKYSVVIGLNELSLYIAENLQRHMRVIMLYNNEDSAWLQRCKDLGAWMIKGHAASESALRKTHFERSEQVYITSDSEEDNFRCVQEMDQLVETKKVKPNEAEWYVHLQNSPERNTLQEIIRSSNRTVLTSFYIKENTAERLLIKFPLNRYAQKAGSNMRAVIFGFTDIALQLLIALVQQGVYLDDKALHIHIYHENSEAGAVAAFKRTYSFLFAGEATGNATGDILQRITGNRLTITFTAFEPAAEQLPDNTLLSNWLTEDATLSCYVCLGSGIRNASFLFLFLPRLNYLFTMHRNCDVGVFWYYNFSDGDEEKYLQKKLNALAPHLLIESFGNYLSETKLQAINNQTMNHMARQIALWYYFAYDYKNYKYKERNQPYIDDMLTQLLTEEGCLKEYKTALAEKDYKTSRDGRIAIHKRIWHKAINHTGTGKDLKKAMNECWKTLSETDREANRQAANHIWVKLLEGGIGWELSDDDHKPVPGDTLNRFWQDNTKASLAILEHRRWNTMKLMEGWQTFAGTDTEWEQHKELLKKQRIHNLMVAYDVLPEDERDKDFHQIEGIPFFLTFYFRQKLGKRIWLKNEVFQTGIPTND